MEAMPLWWRKSKCEVAKRELQEIGSDADLDCLFSQDAVVVFKHSTSCPVSWVAHSQVTKFLGGHPEASVVLVNVIKERPVSQEIARRTGVKHESPQIIVLRRGKVVAAISHGDITEARLAEVVAIA